VRPLAGGLVEVVVLVDPPGDVDDAVVVEAALALGGERRGGDERHGRQGDREAPPRGPHGCTPVWVRRQLTVVTTSPSRRPVRPPPAWPAEHSARAAQPDSQPTISVTRIRKTVFCTRSTTPQ